MIPESEPTIRRDDKTPSVLEQAGSAGWECGMYSFGGTDDGQHTYLNPGLVRRPDGLWLLVRRSENLPGSPFGVNAIWAVKLDETGRIAIKGTKLRWNDEQEGQQFEDGRAFHVDHLGQVGISACTFRWFGNNSWTGAIQVLGFFDQEWNCKVAHFVPFDTNGRSLEIVPRERFQKNWLFWMRENQLHLLYKSEPFTVCQFGGNWHEQRVHVNEGAKWGYGQIRGGTPPVLVGDRYVTFFHSSTEWRGNYRRYYAGALTFSAEPPFEVLDVTPEPLLIGSQNDPWQQRRPLCIFPCGAVLENGKWLVTCGINDIRAGWFSIPHESLLNHLKGGASPSTQQLSQPKPTSQDTAGTEPAPTSKPESAVKPRRDRRKTKTKRTPEQQAAIDARMAKVRSARKKLATSPATV